MSSRGGSTWGYKYYCHARIRPHDEGHGLLPQRLPGEGGRGGTVSKPVTQRVDTRSVARFSAAETGAPILERHARTPASTGNRMDRQMGLDRRDPYRSGTPHWRSS